ncbi:MAG TPA: hypothetical protein VM735_08420 [Candidatus Kapabacteria bacterium]|nr:hypothetical protein [Candidatus Kapabacteria bacterium]
MKVHFSPSTQFQYLQFGGLKEDIVLLKCQMPRSDLAAFIASSPFATERLTSERNDCIINWPPPEWDVATAQPFVSASVPQPNGALMITVAHPESELPTVYLYLYETTL